MDQGHQDHQIFKYILKKSKILLNLFLCSMEYPGLKYQGFFYANIYQVLGLKGQKLFFHSDQFQIILMYFLIFLEC